MADRSQDFKPRDIFTLKPKMSRNLREIEENSARSRFCKSIFTLCCIAVVVLTAAVVYYHFKNTPNDPNENRCFIPFGLIKTNFNGKIGYILRYFEDFNYYNPSCLKQKDTEKYFDGNSVSFFYNVKSNDSFIIDNIGKRCFIVNINENELMKTSSNENVSPRVVINKMEVLFPHIKELDLFRSNIKNKKILDYTVYRLQNERFHQSLFKPQEQEFFKKRVLLSFDESVDRPKGNYDPKGDLLCLSKSRPTARSNHFDKSKNMEYLLKMIGTSWLHMNKGNKTDHEANNMVNIGATNVPDIISGDKFVIMELDSDDARPIRHTFQWNNFVVNVNKESGQKFTIMFEDKRLQSKEQKLGRENIVIFEIVNAENVINYEKFRDPNKKGVFKKPTALAIL